MRLRLRLPEGTTTTLELDASTPFNELLREVAKAAGTTPDQVSLKHGMPPTALQLAGTAPISDALQTMETVIVAVCSTTSDQQIAARPGGQLVDDEVSESEGEFADEFDDSPTRRLVKLTQCAMDRDGAASPVIMPRRPTEAPPEQTPEERRAMAKLVLQTLLQREAGDNSTNYGARFSDPAPLRFSATPRPYTPSPVPRNAHQLRPYTQARCLQTRWRRALRSWRAPSRTTGRTRTRRSSQRHGTLSGAERAPRRPSQVHSHDLSA